MEKICPLILNQYLELNLPKESLTKNCSCKTSECAWYDLKYGRCAVLSQACKK